DPPASLQAIMVAREPAVLAVHPQHPLAARKSVRLSITADHWDKVLRTNVVGTFLVSQAALPLLRLAGDGWIINITSLAGIRQVGSSLPYAVSKAALGHLTAIMAKYAGGGVRVNAVAPGLVATPWTEQWHDRKAGVELAAPLHRVAT